MGAGVVACIVFILDVSKLQVLRGFDQDRISKDQL